MVALDVGRVDEALLALGIAAGHGRAVPVDWRRLAEVRTLTAVEQAADDLALRIVVWRGRIFVQIEAREPAQAGDVQRVIGLGQAVEIEARQAFADVLPVERRGEFTLVDAVSG
ncbi:hypothetical protein [Caulobacter segnis]